MARWVFTHRRPLRPSATPEEVIRYYRSYRMCHGDDVGQFLAAYHRLWREAHEHGVTELEGIRRLVRLLPSDWQGWARDLAQLYTREEDLTFHVVGDFLSLISTLQESFTRFGAAQRGPYLSDRAYPPLPGTPVPTPPSSPSPRATSPGTSILGRRQWEEDSEAGPSRVRARLSPDTSLAQTISSGDGSSVGTATLDRLDGLVRGRDRGKAPVVVASDEDEPVPAEEAPLSDLSARCADLRLQLQEDMRRSCESRRLREEEERRENEEWRRRVESHQRWDYDFSRRLEGLQSRIQERRRRFDLAIAEGRDRLAALDYSLEEERQPQLPVEPPAEPEPEDEEEEDPEEADSDGESDGEGDDEGPLEGVFEFGYEADDDPDEGGFQPEPVSDSDHSTIDSE